MRFVACSRSCLAWRSVCRWDVCCCSRPWTKLVARCTQPTPQELVCCRLADKGDANNLHVALTGFTFGKPVIETHGQGRECVWLPVELTPRPKKAPKFAPFFRADVRDQAVLDEFVKRSRLEALVATGLPNNSRWQVTAGPRRGKPIPS